MYSSNSNKSKSCSDIVIEGIGQGIARIIVILAVAGIWSCYEFIWNPNNNYSVQVEGAQVYTVAGMKCGGQKAVWHFQMLEVWDAGDNNKAKLLAWIQNSPRATPLRLTELEVKEKEYLTLPECSPGEETRAAYIWSISSTVLEMHLRVRQFELYPSQNYKSPIAVQED